MTYLLCDDCYQHRERKRRLDNIISLGFLIFLLIAGVGIFAFLRNDSNKTVSNSTQQLEIGESDELVGTETTNNSEYENYERSEDPEHANSSIDSEGRYVSPVEGGGTSDEQSALETEELYPPEIKPENIPELMSGIQKALFSGNATQWRSDVWAIGGAISVSDIQRFDGKMCRTFRYTVQKGKHQKVAPDRVACRNERERSWYLESETTRVE